MTKLQKVVRFFSSSLKKIWLTNIFREIRVYFIEDQSVSYRDGRKVIKDVQTIGKIVCNSAEWLVEKGEDSKKKLRSQSFQCDSTEPAWSYFCSLSRKETLTSLNFLSPLVPYQAINQNCKSRRSFYLQIRATALFKPLSTHTESGLWMKLKFDKKFKLRITVRGSFL